MRELYNNVATVMSEEPHQLTVGSVVMLIRLPLNNSTGIGSSGFNGRLVIGITRIEVSNTLNADPGSSTLTNQTRTVDDLPNFEKNEYSKSFYVYDVEEVKKHITANRTVFIT